MNARDAIRLGLNQSNMVVQMYLGDLTDAELLVRPVPGTNHIAWQLGHLLSSSHQMIETVCPGVMAPLPAGFADKYTAESSKFDSPSAFHSKALYMSLYEQHREGTQKALEKITDADLDKPSPESFKAYAPTHGDILMFQSSHWLMHAGQWAVTRRKLGRAPLF
ncbi:MAG: DinB family protein [Planctomycetaceae bacterium]|nr:DinB family protein [Planctomycetaceae bacterium]